MRVLTAEEIRKYIGCDFLVGGSSAIRNAGWTTQVQRMPELITRGPTLRDLDGVRLRSRTPELFDALMAWTCPMGYAPDGLLSGGSDWPVLLPGMAIADALVDRRNGGGTHIYDPDDLDPDEVGDGATDDLKQALKALGQETDGVPLVDDYLRALAGEAGPGPS